MCGMAKDVKTLTADFANNADLNQDIWEIRFVRVIRGQLIRAS